MPQIVHRPAIFDDEKRYPFGNVFCKEDPYPETQGESFYDPEDPVESLFVAGCGFVVGDVSKESPHGPIFSWNLVIEEEIEGFDSTAPDFVSRLADFNRNNMLIPFEDEDLNKMCGGIRPGTLGVVCTGTNVGKSLTLQHFTSGYLRQGRNVLYFSGELKAGSVANRILANLTGTSVDLIKKMPQGEIASIWSEVAGKIGRMVIHEYGTGTGNVMMFRSSIEQLQNRNGFKPDVIVVDHIQNCKPTGNATGLNLYQSYGLVAKELRQLAQELDIPLWSAAQANRQGQNGRLDLTNIGDSLQIVQDADTVLMMWRDESLPDYVHVSVPKRRDPESSWNEKRLARMALAVTFLSAMAKVGEGEAEKQCGVPTATLQDGDL